MWLSSRKMRTRRRASAPPRHCVVACRPSCTAGRRLDAEPGLESSPPQSSTARRHFCRGEAQCIAAPPRSGPSHSRPPSDHRRRCLLAGTAGTRRASLSPNAQGERPASSRLAPACCSAASILRRPDRIGAPPFRGAPAAPRPSAETESSRAGPPAPTGSPRRGRPESALRTGGDAHARPRPRQSSRSHPIS